MSETTSVPDSTENGALTSPGLQLQTARLANKTSLQDIADALNLPVKKIEALERDDYAEFSGRTYVRGYLLGYARYLRVDTAAIDQSFAAVFTDDHAPQFSFNSLQIESTSGVSINYLLVLVVLLVIISVGAVIYFTLFATTSSPQSSSVIPSSTTAQQPRTGTFDLSMGPSQALAHPANPAGSRFASQLPATTLIDLEISADGTKNSNDSPAPESQPPVSSEIVLKFNDQSWADIRASDGAKLLYNLQPADSEVTLSTSPPLQVFLGNAAAVTIFYNGQPYDYPVRGRIAQFTLKAPINADPINADLANAN